MNTVMDDNKVLTLVSQERIPLTPEMRLILEVSNLRNATPATVSRGGVLFINDSDVGWRPFFESWLSKYKKAEDEDAENVFTLAASQYLSDQALDELKQRASIAPMCDIARVKTLTCILDHLYSEMKKSKVQMEHIKKLKEEGKEEDIKTLYEAFFVFAAMWALGGPLEADDKNNFSKNFSGQVKVRFPDVGTIFDYFWDPIAANWTSWNTLVKAFDPSRIGDGGLYNNLVVPTAETTRQRYLLNIHAQAKKGVMYVGQPGTGKTVIIQDYFSTLDPEYTLTASINFNSYTDSKALQVVVMGNVDKRAGKQYGPPVGKTLIYFMDDLNMPFVDKYGTQSPICLVRQIIDHAIVYDRDHLEEQKVLLDVMFAACMNPKGGSFFVDLRLTRHLTMISCVTADREILAQIYQQILQAHFASFDKSFLEIPRRIVAATSQIFTQICLAPSFFPTARKFHY